jgi:hypothetical protein
MKHGEALSQLLFNFALDYAIRKVQGNKERLELNRTHQLSICVDGTYLLGANINIIKRSTFAVHSTLVRKYV